MVPPATEYFARISDIRFPKGPIIGEHHATIYGFLQKGCSKKVQVFPNISIVFAWRPPMRQWLRRLAPSSPGYFEGSPSHGMTLQRTRMALDLQGDISWGFRSRHALRIIQRHHYGTASNLKYPSHFKLDASVLPKV